MAKIIIPGLSFVPADEEEGELIEIPSFFGDTVTVPQAHRSVDARAAESAGKTVDTDSGIFKASDSSIYQYGNCRPRDDFVKVGTIYEGNFGTVYKCRDKRNGQIFALKKFIFTPQMLRNGIPASFLREISILKLLKHANIVNSHGTVAGKKLESNFLLLDYCVTSLHELIKKKCDAIYERDVVKYIMRQLFDGLSYIHESLIVHRNISCRNLLFTECGTLKISGFRTARFHDQDNMTPAVTELAYTAPELLFKSKYGQPADVWFRASPLYKAKYGQPADIWSAGCVLAHLLLKKLLFTGDSELAVLKSMFSILGTPSEAIWPGFDNFLQRGTDDEKVVINSQPYSEIKNILAGLPEPSSQLLQDLIVYYPAARWKAQDVMKSHYILGDTPECSPETMKMILDRALAASELLDVPMQVDS